jgi:hypothetical protein
MQGVVLSKLLIGRPARFMAVAFGLAMVSASPNPWPDLAKSDRVESPADCRGIGATETIECLGVVLPLTQSDVYEVAPGLTVVGQVPG